MTMVYRQSRLGIAILLREPRTRAMITERATRAEQKAKSSAPVFTGDYRASIHLEQDTTDRAVVRIVAGVDYAMAVEARTGNLARCLDAAGGS